MPALSAGDLTLLRTHPHTVKEYLAVMQPATVLACRLNGAPTEDPVTEIDYDNVTEGSYTDVVVGMTLWVGTSAGGRQKGACRIRKAPTSSVLHIAEDSAIDWEDNDYLTVVENYEFWVKYPRIVVDDGDDITFYKDWDATYSDQHSNWAPVAILGPPDCQFIDPGTGLATCKFVGEHSYAVAPGASLSSYSWSFPGGTPATASTAGTDAAPHSVTWDTPGIYWVSLTVTDSNGKTHTGRRPVFIFNQSGEGAPYTRFKMTGRSGDLNQHGHTASFEIHGDADQAEFPDGAMVVYFTEDRYGDTQQSIGGNFKYRAHIKLVAYIQKESTTKDPQTSVVTFEAATINALMDTREGFSAWIKTESSASDWCQATNLTADRAALSLARYNSTLVDIADVLISGDTLLIKSQEFAAKSSLLNQLQTLYDDLFAHVASDKQGRVYFDIDPQMKSLGDRSSIAIIADLQHGDWRDRLDLPRPQEGTTSFVNLGGVYYPGYPAEVEAILSKAPGDAPAYQGTTVEINGLILAGQSDGNEKAGLALARDNNQFPDVTVPMAGLWEVFDIVPQEYIRLSLTADDTKRGIVWTNQKLIPRRVNLDVEDTEHGRVPRITIQVEKESCGPPGVDGDYPDEVPESDVDLNPYIPEPLPLPGGVGGDGNVLYLMSATRMYRTRNARAADPDDVTYEDLGLIDPDELGLFWFALDSWDCVNGAMACGENGVWRTTNLNSDTPTWTKVLDLSGYAAQLLWAYNLASSICQQGLWMVTVLDYRDAPTTRKLYIYWTTNYGQSWSNKLITNTCSYNKAFVETSSHNAQRAWVTYMDGDSYSRVAKTSNQWSTFDIYKFLLLDRYTTPAKAYHRYLNNPDDAIGLYVARDTSLICSDDYLSCTLGALDTGLSGDTLCYAGGYTWGEGGFRVLSTGSGPSRLHLSENGYTWTVQKSWPSAPLAGCISGFPYAPDRLYVGMQSGTAPLQLSEDRGETWQAQTGNWSTICPGGTAIKCLVPVWLD